MRKLIILMMLIAMLGTAGIVAAEPKTSNPNAYELTDVTCSDGWTGVVLAPSEPAKPGFFDYGIEGLGIPRGAKIYFDGVLVDEYTQPGNGYQDRLVTCSYVFGYDPEVDAVVSLELLVQRVFTGKG